MRFRTLWLIVAILLVPYAGYAESEEKAMEPLRQGAEAQRNGRYQEAPARFYNASKACEAIDPKGKVG